MNAGADRIAEPQIVWRRSEATTALLSELGLPAVDGALPFMRKTDVGAIDSAGYDVYFSLTAGILYSWRANHPAVAAIGGPASEQTQREALEKLGQGFDIETIEELIVDAASVVRRDFGSEYSIRVLENGLEIDPTSSVIRSDLITDAAVVSYRNGPNPDLSELIIATFTDVDLEVLDIEPRQIMLASLIAAKVDLERNAEEIQRDFDEYAPLIGNDQLRLEVLKLLGESDDRHNPFSWLQLVDQSRRSKPCVCQLLADCCRFAVLR